MSGRAEPAGLPPVKLEQVRAIVVESSPAPTRTTERKPRRDLSLREVVVG